MQNMKKMLDLFAGFGGQSQAFLDAEWDVLRIDNNPLLGGVENMVLLDIKNLSVTERTVEIEYVHASPPCLDFSTAYSSPRGRAQRGKPDEEYLPDLSLLFEAMRIIEELKPRYWSIENVRGAIRYFEPYLGKPSLIIGAWVYWGNFPLFDTSSIEIVNKSQKDKRHSPLRANHRAHIDLNVSKAFLNSMTSQKSILDF